MLVLFETPAGYSLFKVSDEKKLLKTDAEDIYDKFFENEKKATKALQMVQFQPFRDTADAVTAAVSTMEGKMTKNLKSFLKKASSSGGSSASKLAVADKVLAGSINEGLAEKFKVVHDSKTQEIFRGIRCYMENLVDASSAAKEGEAAVASLSASDLHAMQLGLSHSLGRYKLKFSADKVDTMIIQAVGLLDELDKEINTYAMRVKEWYGWHFPELQAIVSDNVMYSKLVLLCGVRTHYHDADLTSVLEDDENTIAAVKEAAEISMGTEIADIDVINIRSLAEQVLSMTEYRSQLFEYLRNRMNAIAPNLTVLVGELVGARLISHAGSLMNLAKQPASTIQILGAEKALFRALKTKHDTPKYGLIYHASLVGQAAPKHKGKISRVLAAKAALAIRVDALSDETTTARPGEEGEDDDDEQQQQQEVDTTVGYEGRAKVEARLRQLEGGSYHLAGTTAGKGTNLTSKKTTKYDPVAAKVAASGPGYNDASDMVLDDFATPAKKEEQEADSSSGDEHLTEKEKKKKAKKEKKEKKKKRKSTESASADDDDAPVTPTGKATESEEKSSKKKKKKEKKKRKLEESPDGGDKGDDDDDDKEARRAAKKAKKMAKKEKRKSKGSSE